MKSTFIILGLMFLTMGLILAATGTEGRRDYKRTSDDEGIPDNHPWTVIRHWEDANGEVQTTEMSMTYKEFRIFQDDLREKDKRNYQMKKFMDRVGLVLAIGFFSLIFLIVMSWMADGFIKAMNQFWRNNW